jgi:hypothetical protein
MLEECIASHHVCVILFMESCLPEIVSYCDSMVLFHMLFVCYFRYNRFENNREASLQTAKAPAAQVVTANQKPTVEAGGDALIDLSDEAAPSVGAKGAPALPNLNTKFTGLSMSPRLSGSLLKGNELKCAATVSTFRFIISR